MKNNIFTKKILIIEIILCFAIGFLTIINMNTRIENKPLMIAKSVKAIGTTVKTGKQATTTPGKKTGKQATTTSGKNTGTATSKATGTASSKATGTATSKATGTATSKATSTATSKKTR